MPPSAFVSLDMALRPPSHYSFGLDRAAADADDAGEADVADDDDDRTMVALVQDLATHSLSLTTVPLPVPSNPDDHLVQVHAVAITRGELVAATSDPAVVVVPGYEFAGTVVLAPTSSPFQPGAEVYACASVQRPGGASEYTLARTHEMCQKPENLSWEEAATVPRSALAAWQALFVLGGIVPPPPPPPRQQQLSGHANTDKRVLVTNAAGGVGLWVVQLARLAGVGHVVGTCGPANVDFVCSLGAHRVEESVAKAEGAYNLVVHCGDEDADADADADEDDAIVLRRWRPWPAGCTLVCLAGSGMKTTVLADRGVGRVESSHVAVQADSVQLQAVTDLVEAGAAKAAFDSAFAPEQYEAALVRVQDRHLRGKVVLRLD